GAGWERPRAARAGAVRKAQVSVHEGKSAWTRHDLLKHLGWTLPVHVRQLAPADTVRLLHRLAGEALAGRYGDVRCLEAPEVVPLPERLMRADGRSVYRRHGGTRYATLVQLTTEERMVARAGRALAHACEPAGVAELLGSDTRTLDAQLLLRAEAAGEAKT